MIVNLSISDRIAKVAVEGRIDVNSAPLQMGIYRTVHAESV